MDFLATPDTVTGTAGSATPGAPTRVGLLTDGTSPNDASKNWAKYYNMLLEEMRHIIVTFGGTPDDDNWHQAADNLKLRLIANGVDADLSQVGSSTRLDGIDLDDVVAVGEYYVRDTCTNKPFLFGLMKVWREVVGIVYQQVQGAGDDENMIATRYLSALGVWTAWRYSVTASTAAEARSFIAYPKLVAAGNGDFTFSTAGSAHVLTATQAVPSPIDLTNTTKYVLQFTLQGAGVTDSDQKYVTWSCTKAAGSSFNLEVHIFNDSSSLFNNGTANYSWSVIQLTA